jgi:hypothetical protein
MEVLRCLSGPAIVYIFGAAWTVQLTGQRYGTGSHRSSLTQRIAAYKSVGYGHDKDSEAAVGFVPQKQGMFDLNFVWRRF